MVLNTLNFTLTVTLFAYPFKTDVGYSVLLTVDGKQNNHVIECKTWVVACYISSSYTVLSISPFSNFVSCNHELFSLFLLILII